ncbi:MAG: ABC transporter substrate-binding protein [Desulfarculaceae bacterium]
MRNLLATLFLAVVLASLALPAAAEASKPVLLGCPLPRSHVTGWLAERAIKLAVEEVNAAGGVKVEGRLRPFAVEVIDTRDLEPGVPVSQALLALERLILEKKADFILGGPARSEAALVAMNLLAKQKKISILSTGSLSPRYHRLVAETPRFKYCFRISGEVGWMVKGEIVPCLLRLQKQHGLNRLFIMAQDVAHGRAGGKLIAKIMRQKGWNVVAEPRLYPTGSSDFSLGLHQAKKLKAQIILIWMDMPEAAILIKQWHDLKVPALPFGSIISAAEQPGFWKATQGKGEYTLGNVVNAGNSPSEATPWTMKFVNAYKKRYQLEPEGYGTSSSYMAVYTLKDAIERAGSLDTDKVLSALEKTDLMGVYGRIRFDPKSHQVIPSLDPKEGAVGTIFQWQKGRRVPVFPSTLANSEILLPPGVK